MRDFEMDFDFEEGVGCQRTSAFRVDTYCALSGMQKSRVFDIAEQIFTPEREARIQAHRKRVQAELKRRK